VVFFNSLPSFCPGGPDGCAILVFVLSAGLLLGGKALGSFWCADHTQVFFPLRARNTKPLMLAPCSRRRYWYLACKWAPMLEARILVLFPFFLYAWCHLDGRCCSRLLLLFFPSLSSRFSGKARPAKLRNNVVDLAVFYFFFLSFSSPTARNATPVVVGCGRAPFFWFPFLPPPTPTA